MEIFSYVDFAQSVTLPRNMSFCAGALERSNDFYAPERLAQRKMGKFYQEHPVMSRLATVPLAFVSGAIKPFLFPLWAVVGVVAMPIIAAVRAVQGKGDALKWLGAWAFSLLAVAGFVGFMIVTSFYIPLIYSCAIFVGAVALSITIHVYKAVSAPEIPEDAKS